MYGIEMPAVVEKKIAAKMEEAHGLLGLVKPLIKRAGRLTAAEQEILTTTLQQAADVLHQAQQFGYEALKKSQHEKATATSLRLG